MKNETYDSLFKKALLAGKNRDYNKAISCLKTIVTETDTFPQALLYLGRSYHAVGEYEKAIRAYKYFISSQPQESAGYFFLGRTFLVLEYYDHAIVYLRKALGDRQGDAFINGLLGLAYLRVRKSELALRYFETAIYKDPENQKLYMGYINALTVQAVKQFQMGNYDLSGQMFRFIKEHGNKGILPHVYLALIERELGNYDHSLLHYNKAIELSPDDELLKLGRASVLLLTGDVSKAQTEISRLSNLFPELKQIQTSSEAMVRFLAIQCFRKREYQKAVHYAKKIIKRNGSDPEMHLLMGEAKRNLGNLEAANNHFHRVLDVQKNHIEARYGIILVLWIRKQYGKILRELNHIRKIDPNDPYLSYYELLCKSKLDVSDESLIDDVIGEIRKSGPDTHLLNTLAKEYYKTGYIELSEKWFNKALRIDRNNGTSLQGLIDCALYGNEHEKIVSSFKNYLNVFQGDNEQRREFIRYLVKNEHYSVAIKELQRYQAHIKNDYKLNRLLALCFRKTKQYDEAGIIYRNLLKTDPKNQEYLLNLVYCLYKNGRSDRALALLEKARAFLPPSTDILLVHGSLLYRANESEKALSLFRKILEDSPGEWRAYRNISLIYKHRGMHELAAKFQAHANKYKQTIGT